MKAWDTYRAYLFDIDGTLLHCHDAVHYFGFCKVLTEIAGRPLKLDGVGTHGNTDIGILRDALLLAQVDEATWRSKLPGMHDTLCSFVEDHASEFRIDVLPAVSAVLAHLRARGALLGLATGNLERIGWAKLSAAGLAASFDFGGFSDLCENRTQVFKAALLRARTIAADPLVSVCVVGDTPADVRAAYENDLDVIAVATGTYSYEELRAANPTLLVRSLDELLSPDVLL